ncbi:hypothetical protein [Bacillus sp. ISL-55]|uniref:hypothetical protein n=1 Tax=Bacillus sp. ISL-55 TaxID=2819134 RepID=UPI001BE84388|nr:hypothetical protein [Bacillus sp. ISL-55]MBT2692716.1 hypothetical protein [Bacillus sp. ISL-55]
MQSNLSTEEQVKLKHLKLQLMNAQTPTERHSILKDIEQLLNKAKYRNRFMSTLKDNEKL